MKENRGLEKALIGICIVALLSVAVSGCLSSSQSTSSSPTPQSTASTVSPTVASDAQASPSATTRSTPTPTGTLLPTQVGATKISSVSQGEAVTFVTTLYSPNEHKNVCGAPNYYIDDYAAGGKWNINPQGTCSASSGSLSLSGADTAKLSVGAHTLKVDYLGDSTHAGSQFVEQFTVTSPPTPSLLPSVTPTPTVPPGQCNCYGPDLDCKDFSTQAQAQACYSHCMAVTGKDVFGLDRDKDGIACEDNP